MECTNRPQIRIPWNKGKLVGQKAPFKPKEVWAIRARLQMENRARELALFDLGIDSKLRACDIVSCGFAMSATVIGLPAERPSCSRRRSGRASSRSRRQLGRRGGLDSQG